MRNKSSFSFLDNCLDSTISCRIIFTPTVQHCSMATVIGLCLRLKLMQNFSLHFKVPHKFLDYPCYDDQLKCFLLFVMQHAFHYMRLMELQDF
jgi:hypothetical protein